MKDRFKSKVKAGDTSQVTNQTIGQVTISKIWHIVNKVNNDVPYAIFLSKNSLMWSDRDTLFSDLSEDDPIRIRYIGGYNKKENKFIPAHLPGRRPTNLEFSKMEFNYGVTLPWPPLGLFDIFQDAFREVWDSLILKRSPLILAPCRGYIDKEGNVIDPNWNTHESFSGNRVSGFLIFRVDKINEINMLLDDEKYWLLNRQIQRSNNHRKPGRVHPIDGGYSG